MRRKERERTDRAFMDAVLADTETLWLSMNTGAAPYVIPVNHVLHGGALYIHCAPEGLKLDLIRRDPRVGFSAAADVAILREKASTTYRSVCGTGRAALVEDEREQQAALAAIRERYRSICHLPAPAAMLAKLAIIRIDIESLSGKQA